MLRQTALESTNLFSQSKFKDAFGLLQSLGQNNNAPKESDPRNLLKLQHNVALLQYLTNDTSSSSTNSSSSSTTNTSSSNNNNNNNNSKDKDNNSINNIGFENPRKLLEEFGRIRKSIEEKLSQQENESNGTVEDTQQHNQQSHPHKNSFEDSDLHIVSFNQAVLFIQLKQYASAAILLESLFQNIEPVEESLAMKVCWSLLELYLGPLHVPDKASTVLQFVEQNFLHTNNNNNTNNNQNGGNNNNNKHTSTQAPNDPQQAQQQALFNAQQQELSSLVSVYRARIQLLRVRLSKSMPTEDTLAAVGSPLSLYFRAQLEFLSQQPKNALQSLSKIPQAALSPSASDHYSAPMTSVLYYNNLGAIHFQLRKYSVASLYFSKALQENEKINPQTNKSLKQFSRSKKSEILYNLGLQLLLSNKPDVAFRCFQESSLQFNRDPKLWLRMAECCVLCHIKKVEEKKKKNQKPSGLFQKVVGKGIGRRVVLGMSQPLEPLAVKDALEYAHLQPQDRSSTSSVTLREPQFSLYGTPTLEYGSRCVRNVLILVSANDFSGSADESLNLRQSALANGAFIALSSDNPAVALIYSKDLLSMEAAGIPENIKFLASLYAAESLAMLSRPVEAADYLHPTRLGLGEQSTLSINFPVDSLPSMSTSSVTLNAKHVLFLNLAITHILKEDLPLAQQCLQQAFTVQSSPQALSILIYLLLRQGNTAAALHVVKTQTFTIPLNE